MFKREATIGGSRVMDRKLETHRSPVLPRRLFALRMIRFAMIAVVMDALGLAVGAVGYHYLENLSWLDAGVNAALVMTGNGPIHPPHTDGGKQFTLLFALLGVILFAAVTAVLLIPVFHRIIHRFHSAIEDHHNQRQDAT